MSCLRERRAPSRGRAALVCALLLLATGCGSGDDAPLPVPPGIDLPEVGTLGRSPKGPATIVIDVTADGHITLDGKGPLSLIGLRDELVLRTADPAWREPDRSSLKILLIRADRSLPWTVSQWIMQSAADPQVALYRVFFGARARRGGVVGAIGCALPKDRSGPVDWIDPAPCLSVRVVPRDEAPSEPEDILAPLRAAAGERPLSEVTLDLGSRGGKNGEIPTGFVIRVLDIVLAAGVRDVLFGGAPISKSFEPDDVEGLLDHVAELRANLEAPVLKVARERVAPLPSHESVPVAQGVLAHLYGSRVDKEEPGPARERDRVALHAEVTEEELEEVPEPVIRDEEIEDHLETDSDLPFEESLGSEGSSDAPFDGPAGSPYSPYIKGLPQGKRSGAFPTRERDGERESAVEHALRWLAAHQSPNGGWEAAGFGRWCHGKTPVEADWPDGAGYSTHDVGVTGLALCAFLGAGYTNRGRHPYAKTISKGLRYLKNVQDAEGCFGPRTPRRFVYSHAAAALAMVEAYGMTHSPIFKGSARKALDFVLQCRNPRLAWRYGVRPGDNDTSVTAWMAMPLFAARWINQGAVERDRSWPFPLDDEGALNAVLAWFELTTDPETGRTGYVTQGGRPDRPADLLEWFPPDRSESTTAAAVLLRILFGEDPRPSATIRAGAALLEASPPAWDVERGTIDPVYWYFGSLAARQVGGTTWAAWSAALHGAVRASQRTDTDACRYLGSWDPVGPWGREGGRVASTALLAMCLEADYRYALMFGTR